MNETATQRASREMWEAAWADPSLRKQMESLTQRMSETEGIPDDFSWIESTPRRVEVRDARGEWHSAIAVSEPRYDYDNAWRRGGTTFLSVSVLVGAWGHPVNWPAEDVREADHD